ncbi:winged helix-turn-helix domain-containing protein [Sinomonas sp. P47F7]|uniref:winged helix-turn-helix domain-containing protein n=1 Tax=Sinomonas sp. P47F7 TaxID=3410987 RepID=UPI003BF501FB
MGSALSLSQARRIALSAQGLIGPRPTAPVTTRAVGRTFDRLQLVQIDSVNVLVRSHYLPFFSRLGNYDRDLLDRLASRSPRRMVEYWAHEASFVKPEHFEALRLWQSRTWIGAGSLETAVRDDLAARILGVLATSRPLTSAQLTERLGHIEERRNDNWGWNWNAVKRVVSELFAQGVVSSAGRTPSFERRYALTEAVLPADYRGRGIAAGVRPGIGPGAALGVGLPEDREEAALELTRAALSAHGIGTVRCFADYFRLPIKATERALAELVRLGEAEEVDVLGWEGKQYKDPAARVPRVAAGRALVSPFDSLVFERRRLERLFGFHYRIEIYTPAHRRRYGYYVLPFLLGETLVARVDVKADRAGGALLVHAIHAEPEAPAHTAEELATELRLLADWLTLDDVRVAESGRLAAAVARRLNGGISDGRDGGLNGGRVGEP